jgi:hypothetical protein
MFMVSARRFQPRAHLSTLASGSFILSFIAARVFTTFYPSTVLVSSGIHIHHFWFGLALLSVGGWLGINFNDRETDRIAAILYGAGGGLIVDEVGLLLTFGNYRTGLTYSFLVLLLAFVFIVILFYRYRKAIETDLSEIFNRKLSLYLGVFLTGFSVAFIEQTSIFLVMIVSSCLAATGVIMILAFLVERFQKKH